MRRVSFGPFSFDGETLELARDRERVHLPVQPARVLRLLLSRPGDLVTRAEIQRECWPDTPHGVDPAMNAAVRQIRRALGDSAVRPQWIETLPQRGYRFVGALGRDPAARPRWAVPAASVAAVAAGMLLAAMLARIDRESPALSLPVRTELGKAEHLLARNQVDDAQRSAASFERVLSERPDLARARDGLATALFLLGDRERARVEAERALRLEASSGRAHHVLGLLQLVEDWDFAAAERSLRRARTLEPAQDHFAVSLAYLLIAAGRADEAEEILDRLSRADPVEPAVRSDVGWMFFLLRRFDLAADSCGTAAELMPQAVWAEDCAQGALVRLGREEEAFERVRAALERWGLRDDAPLPVSAGPRASLEAYWDWRASRIERRGPAGDSSYLLATLLANLGRERAALAALEDALRERSMSAVALSADPSFDHVDTGPLLESVTLRAAQRRHR